MHQTSDFCRESGYAFRKAGVRLINGTSAIPHIPGILRDSWQAQSTLSSRLLTRRGQSHGAALRPDNLVNRSEGMQALPATLATHQVLRCRTREASGVSNQQLRLACTDHHSALSLSLQIKNYQGSNQLNLFN